MNRQLINQFKYVYKTAQDITPSVYASIAIPLITKYGWTQDEVEQLFLDSQDEWQNSIGSNDNMILRCERITGIDMRRSAC